MKSLILNKLLPWIKTLEKKRLACLLPFFYTTQKIIGFFRLNLLEVRNLSKLRLRYQVSFLVGNSQYLIYRVHRIKWWHWYQSILFYIQLDIRYKMSFRFVRVTRHSSAHIVFTVLRPPEIFNVNISKLVNIYS